MPVYNVILSTSITTAQPVGNLVKPISNANLADVAWLVNWEGLFGTEIDKYKKCSLRFSMMSLANGSLTSTANTGYLSLTGISTSHQASNYPGTFLALITPNSANRFVEGSLEANLGIDIHIPRGVNELGVRFYNDDATTFQPNIPDYILQLQLHLYNDDI